VATKPRSRQTAVITAKSRKILAYYNLALPYLNAIPVRGPIPDSGSPVLTNLEKQGNRGSLLIDRDNGTAVIPCFSRFVSTGEPESGIGQRSRVDDGPTLIADENAEGAVIDFFDTHDGEFHRDDEGSEQADFEAARKEAMIFLPEVARWEIPKDSPSCVSKK
jgi:hypothetical protein